MSHQSDLKSTSADPPDTDIHPPDCDPPPTEFAAFWDAYYKSERNGRAYVGDILDEMGKVGVGIADVLEIATEMRNIGRIRYDGLQMELAKLKELRAKYEQDSRHLNEEHSSKSFKLF